MSTVLFDLPEEAVAERLGIPRENVRELRVEHLYQDEDWAMVNRSVQYSEDGVRKLRQILAKNAPAGVRRGDLALGRPLEGGKSKDAPTVNLDAVVTRTFPYMPKLLEAELGGRKISVRVASNLNFVARTTNPDGTINQEGTIIPSRELVMKNTVIFDFIGRCPRSKGRW